MIFDTTRKEGGEGENIDLSIGGAEAWGTGKQNFEASTGYSLGTEEWERARVTEQVRKEAKERERERSGHENEGAEYRDMPPRSEQVSGRKTKTGEIRKDNGRRG